MRKFFVHIYQKRLNSQAGVAALMSVIIAMVTLASIALNYIAETQQEQAGSALTYTSVNAQLIAEAGLRYAEKCLKQNKSGCPCYSTCSSSNWPTMASAATVYSVSPFGDTRGAFSFIVTSASTSIARVKSTGTFAGASREMYKNVFTTTTCPLSQNAITSCQAISIENDASISPSGAPTATGQCSATAIPTITFPTGYTGCPNSSYPAFTSGALSSPYQYCSWNQGSVTVAANGDITIYVKGNFTMSNNAILNISGNVTINVGGDIDIKNNAIINIISGSLTMHSVGDFTLENSATMNWQTNSNLGTGMATFTNSSPTVTLASGSWLTYAASAQISANSGTTWYDVSTRDSSTQLTLSSNFTQSTTTTNYVLTDPARLLVLVEGNGQLKNSMKFSGALYGPNMEFELENSAKFLGSVVADEVTLKNSATLTYNSSAGSSTNGYSFCGGSTTTTDQYGGG